MNTLNYFFCKHILCFINLILCVYQKHLYLDSTIPNNNEKSKLLGFTFIRSDHPSNAKRSGVCIYHKSSFTIKSYKDWLFTRVVEL